MVFLLWQGVPHSLGAHLLCVVFPGRIYQCLSGIQPAHRQVQIKNADAIGKDMYKVSINYIISDNIYFSLGCSGLLASPSRVIQPQDALDGIEAIEESTVYIYIQDRVLHRRICLFLHGRRCNIIFFLSGANKIISRNLSPYFWLARMSINNFKVTLKKAICFSGVEQLTTLHLHLIFEN